MLKSVILFNDKLYKKGKEEEKGKGNNELGLGKVKMQNDLFYSIMSLHTLWLVTT
jgi:hypothetical protein